MRMRIAARLATPALALALGAAATTGARAQTVSLIGKLGGYIPVNEVYDIPGELETLAIDRKADLSIGAAIEVSPMFWPVDVRVGADYLTGSQVSLDGVSGGPTTADASLLMVSGDLVLRPIPRLVILHPFILAGLAYKREMFEPSGGAASAVPEDFSDRLFHLGIGFDLGLGPLDVVAEVSDYFAAQGSVPGQGLFDSRHDLFASVGLKVGLF